MKFQVSLRNNFAILLFSIVIKLFIKLQQQLKIYNKQQLTSKLGFSATAVRTTLLAKASD